MLYIWLVVTFLLDRISKHLVMGGLLPGHSVPLLGGLIRLTHVRNTGAAFGMLAGYSGLFVVITAALVGGALWFYHRSPYAHLLHPAGLGLVMGGALGNLADRLLWGFVIDFIDLRVWPVFNIADMAIVVGGFILLLHYHRAGESAPEEVGR